MRTLLIAVAPWILDHSTTSSAAAGSTGGADDKGGDLLFPWGNPSACGPGSASDPRLFGQHDPRWIDGGKAFTVLNNGLGPTLTPSTVDEGALPHRPPGLARTPVGRPMPTWLSIGLLLATASALGTQEADFSFPQTPAAGRTAVFLEAYNSSTEASLVDLDNLRSAASREQLPLETLRGLLESFAQQTGSLQPHSVLESSATQLALLVRGSKAGAWVKLDIRCQSQPPYLVDSFTLVPAAAPSEALVEYLEWKALTDLLALGQQECPVPALALALLSTEGPMEEAAIGSDAGLAQVDDPVRGADRFHAGSLTKAMTASMIARLVERGELAWTTTLAEALEGTPMLSAYGPIELQQVLRHRAGIQAHTAFDQAGMDHIHNLPGSPSEKRAAWIGEVLSEAPVAAPGSTMTYSNAGYTVAAVLAERATGRSWETLMDELLFKPLGMESVVGGWPPADETSGHYGDGSPARPDYYMGACLAPAGDLSMRVADLARFGRMHLEGLQGKDGLLTSTTIRELHRPAEDKTGQPYAAGWLVTADPRGEPVHWHNGSAGTYYALLAVYPTQDLVVAVMMNMAAPNGEAVAWKLVEAILQRRRDPK